MIFWSLFANCERPGFESACLQIVIAWTITYGKMQSFNNCDAWWLREATELSEAW